MAGTYKSIFKPKHPKNTLVTPVKLSVEVIGKGSSVITVTLIKI